MIETLINRALSFDARSPERLKKLQGKKLSVEISDLKLKVLIQFSAQGIQVQFSNGSGSPRIPRSWGSFLFFQGRASCPRRSQDIPSRDALQKQKGTPASALELIHNVKPGSDPYVLPSVAVHNTVKVDMSEPGSDDPDVYIKGPLRAFLSLLISKDPHTASRLGLSLEGDMQVAEDSQNFFLNLQIDWEEIFSRFTGDTLAHPFFSLMRKGRQKGRILWNNLSVALRDYLQEETRVLPTPPEVELFLDDVDAVNLDIDRLAARLTQLEATEESLE